MWRAQRERASAQNHRGQGVVVLNAPEGKIQCTLKTNTIACPGPVIAEVRISSDAVLLTSAQFKFYVRKSLINDDTIKSTDEFPVLTQLMQDTSSLIDQVNKIEKQVPENVVQRIDDMETGKFDKNDIVQTDTISDATKVASTVVTAAHRRELDELNKNLALKLVSDCDNAVYVLNQRTRYYCTTGTNAPVSGVATFVIDAIGDTNTINYVQEAICTYKGVTTAIVGQRFFRSHTSAGFGEWKSYSVM